MSNPSSDSYRNVTRYTGQDYSFAARYLRNRDPITPSSSPDIRPKEQQGYYPYASLWSTNPSGNLWALTQIVNNLGHWILLSTGTSGPILNIAVPNGTSPVFPTNLGQVSFTSSGSSIVITGSTNSINYDVSGSKVLQTLTGDTGGAISPSGGNINLSGAVTTYVTGTPSTHTLTTEVVSTANTFLLGAGPTAHSTTIGPLTSGQVIIGSTGVAPVASTLTAGDNIVITNGAGSITIASTAGGPVANLGIGLSAGTFSVQSASGAALSASNPAYISLQSLVTPGVVKTYSVTANQTFTSATLGNSLFGITSAVNIATDVPFYLYAVSNSAALAPETTVAFMISRYPNTRISPVAAKIGQSGNTHASTQGSFFSLASITASDYASSPCLCVGSFRMQYTGGTTSWAVSALSINDGVGNFQEGVPFVVPTSGGQFGAATGSLFYANGGTAPIFSNYSNGYYVSRDNKIYFSTAFQNCTNSGVGSVTLQLASPYSMDGAVNGNMVLSYTNSTQAFIPTVQPTGPDNQIAYFVPASAAPSFVLNSNIGADATFKFDSWIFAPIDFS